MEVLKLNKQTEVILNFKTKISSNSVDNYEVPILFNLYKIWNLLISVKLYRQRNTFVCCILSSNGILVLLRCGMSLYSWNFAIKGGIRNTSSQMKKWGLKEGAQTIPLFKWNNFIYVGK